jgi:hypothetical protein
MRGQVSPSGSRESWACSRLESLSSFSAGPLPLVLLTPGFASLPGQPKVLVLFQGRRPSTPFAPFGDATRGREPPVRAASPGPTGRDGRPAGARRPPGTAQRPVAERRDRPPHRPDPVPALWAGVSFGRAGVRPACTVPHTVPASSPHLRCGAGVREAHVGRCVLPGGQVCVLPALRRTPSWRPHRTCGAAQVSGRHTWAGVLAYSQGFSELFGGPTFGVIAPARVLNTRAWIPEPIRPWYPSTRAYGYPGQA